VGHNVVIGDHTAIAGCTGIAGSTTIGSHCMIGGGVGINGHIEITDQVIITGKSAVAESITEKGVYSSTLRSLPFRKWQKALVRLLQIDSLFSRVKNLEEKIK